MDQALEAWQALNWPAEEASESPTDSHDRAREPRSEFALCRFFSPLLE